MHYNGIPGRYLDHVLREEIEVALRDPGVASESAADAGCEQARRADLNDEIARAALGGGTWDFVTLLSPMALADGPVDGALTRLARRLGLLGS